MERIVSSFLRFMTGRGGMDSSDIAINRIAQGSSHDRALSAFKADQARIASRQDGATFQSKRGPSKG